MMLNVIHFYVPAKNCPEHQVLSPENPKFRTTTPSAVKPSVNFLTVEREASMLASQLKYRGLQSSPSLSLCEDYMRW